jgi:hypothetical protein
VTTPPVDDLRRAAANSLYVGVGLSLLAVQAVQVRRRQLERDLGLPVPPRPADLSRLLGRVTGRD